MVCDENGDNTDVGFSHSSTLTIVATVEHLALATFQTVYLNNPESRLGGAYL